MKEKSSILQGPIFPALTKFAVPILLSLILQALYGAVDLWMVSQFGSNADVSAVSTGSQTIMIVNGIVTGLSMGITILLGISVGEKNDKRSADIIGTSVWIFTFAGVALSIFLMLAAPNLAKLLNAPPEALEKTAQYISICGAGTIFVVAYNVLNGIFCGIGDSATPLAFVGVACIVNIIGDLVLIKFFNLGAVGAAIATISAQAVSVIFSLIIIRKRLPFSVKKENMRFQKDLGLSILNLGAPVAMFRMCSEVSYLMVISFVNSLGVVASSGVGIAEKLGAFIWLIPTAYMSAISAFVAQNMGANQIQRAKKSLWVGMATSAAMGGAMAILSFFYGDLMSQIFIKDPAVIAASAEYLKGSAIDCFGLSLVYCYNGYFNGIAKTKFVMLQGIVASLFVRIPAAYLASIRPQPTLFGIGFAVSLAAMFMFLVCTIYYVITNRKDKNV